MQSVKIAMGLLFKICNLYTWGDGQIHKAFTWQTQGPEFRSITLCYKHAYERFLELSFDWSERGHSEFLIKGTIL